MSIYLHPYVSQPSPTTHALSVFTQLPLELILEVLEYSATSVDLKSLSLTCSALRPAAQQRLFRSLHLSIDRIESGDISDLLVNTRLSSLVLELTLRPGYAPKYYPRKFGQLLLAFSRLERLALCRVALKEDVLGGLLLLLQRQPILLQIEPNFVTIPADFRSCLIESDILHLTELTLIQGHYPPIYMSFIVHILSRSSTSCRQLHIPCSILFAISSMSIPALKVFEVTNQEASATLLRNHLPQFLTLNQQITTLIIDGPVKIYSHDSPLPPSILPNLEVLHTAMSNVRNFVPGRPVRILKAQAGTITQDQVIEIITKGMAKSSYGIEELWTDATHPDLVSELARRLNKLEKLSVKVNQEPFDEQLLHLSKLTNLKYLAISYSPLPTHHCDYSNYIAEAVETLANDRACANLRRVSMAVSIFMSCTAQYAEHIGKWIYEIQDCF